MKLGFEEAQRAYDSGSQRAPAWTETWVGREAFCPSCGHVSLTQFTANRPVADFYCAHCSEEYELKSQKTDFGNKVVDGAASAMRARLAQSDAPNFLFMSYDVRQLAVRHLMVVPKHFVRPEVIEERRPLGPGASRAGWVGCNILLRDIPPSGKVFIVRDGTVINREAVLAQWRRTSFLREESVAAKGWLIEVMRFVEAIGRPEFTLAEVYESEVRLRALYPKNRNVRPKIRQQLQVLRDAGFLEFVGRGSYRLSASRL